MLITFCLALLAAKLRHYRPGLLFRSWTIYPLLATECVYLLFQVFTLQGDYRFVPYASLLKTAYMLLFLIPMLVYRLYWQGLAGSGLIVAGTVLNRIAIHANGGKMPVFPTLSYWTGYARPEAFEGVSALHVLGTSASKCKFLCDFIDVGYCILSIGDLLIRGSAFLILFYTIRELDRRHPKVGKE